MDLVSGIKDWIYELEQFQKLLTWCVHGYVDAAWTPGYYKCNGIVLTYVEAVEIDEENQ